jgi:DNA-binding GntR family transcriptional regulator
MSPVSSDLFGERQQYAISYRKDARRSSRYDGSTTDPDGSHVTNTDLEQAVQAAQLGRRLADHPPLVDDVHDVLVDMVMNHLAEAGTRLNIDALARALAVSPTPIREALARMEAEGLVTKEPRRGYLVTRVIGLEELRSMIDFRLLIEPAAAAAAAERVTDAEAAALLDLARSGGSGDTGSAANRVDMVYDATFHDTIASLGGNPWLRDSLVRLRSHLHMYRLYHHAQHAAATTPEHEHIAQAIADRSPDAAAEAMRRHLHTAMRRLDEVFASGTVSAGKRADDT